MRSRIPERARASPTLLGFANLLTINAFIMTWTNINAEEAALNPQPLTMHPGEEIYLRKDLATAEGSTRVADAHIDKQNRYLDHAKMLLRELDTTRRALAAAQRTPA